MSSANVYLSLVCLSLMDVGSALNISEIQAASIFRVEVEKLVEFWCTYRFIFRNEPWGKTGPGTPFGPIVTIDRDSSERKATALVRATHIKIIMNNWCSQDVANPVAHQI